MHVGLATGFAHQRGINHLLQLVYVQLAVVGEQVGEKLFERGQPLCVLVGRGNGGKFGWIELVFAHAGVGTFGLKSAR